MSSPPPMSAVLKALLGVLLLGVVFTAGCVALFRGSMAVGERSVVGKQESAISDGQAREIELGTPRSEVVATLGEPLDARKAGSDDRASGSCIYYNVRRGLVLDSWQFCFDSKDRLTSKNRL